MKRIIEVRSAEGGADSQLFVSDLINAYTKLATRKGWKSRVVKERPADAGHYEIALEIVGDDLKPLDNEIGGHRIQRIPPTEKRGRVHTSTVTVAIIDPSIKSDVSFSKRTDDDFRIEWFNGTTKAGGQHHQKNATCCRIIHTPTGITQTSQGRSRKANEEEAKNKILEILLKRSGEINSQVANKVRSEQIGSGMRGDKRRTYRFKDDKVSDHETGKESSCREIMKGKLDLLW